MMTLTNYIAFVKAHEKLVIIVLAAFLLFRTGQGIESAWIHHDENMASKAATMVVADTTANKSLADQVAQLKANDLARDKQLDQELESAKTSLHEQQVMDSQATQQQVLDRWKLLVPVKPIQNGSVDTIAPQDAIETVKALEQIPVFNTEVADLNAKILIDDSIVGKQDELIVGLNKELADEKVSHQADVKLEKAKGKRSWIRGFKWGVVVGVAGAEAVRVWAGRP